MLALKGASHGRRAFYDGYWLGAIALYQSGNVRVNTAFVQYKRKRRRL